MLLGFILADSSDGRPLDRQFRELAEARRWGDLRFRPPADWRGRIAPTEFDAWRGRLVRGVVHDENAWALGGVAGHAGLFGSVKAVGRLRPATSCAAGAATTRWSRPPPSPASLAKSPVPGSSRALGWDTMLPTSSCGTRMSPLAFGHTGFTGTIALARIRTPGRTSHCSPTACTRRAPTKRFSRSGRRSTTPSWRRSRPDRVTVPVRADRRTRDPLRAGSSCLSPAGRRGPPARGPAPGRRPLPSRRPGT